VFWFFPELLGLFIDWLLVGAEKVLGLFLVVFCFLWVSYRMLFGLIFVIAYLFLLEEHYLLAILSKRIN